MAPAVADVPGGPGPSYQTWGEGESEEWTVQQGVRVGAQVVTCWNMSGEEAGVFASLCYKTRVILKLKEYEFLSVDF